MTEATRAENFRLLAEASSLLEAGEHRAAMILFRRAALEGDDSAQLNLGYLYDVGLGVRRNRRMALLWYRRAARLGNCSASNNIATIYRDQNKHHLAIQWFRRAMVQGCASSAVTLATLFLSLDRSSDAEVAVRWAQRRRKALSEADREQVQTLDRRLKEMGRRPPRRRSGATGTSPPTS
jgi:TPR repeat protein